MGACVAGDSKHKEPGEEKVKVNLALGVVRMIDFLNEVHKYPCLYTNKRILNDAIVRYETVWLPMMISLPEKDRIALVPPLDVEWVWHNHMLSPAAYKEDVGNVLGNKDLMIDHALLPAKQRLAGRDKARKLWEQKHGKGTYDIEAQLKAVPAMEEGNFSRPANIKYDIAAGCERQMDFHYQVAILLHYRDPKFLHKAAGRYINQFLELKRRRPSGFWVPTYDIDAVWHTHMLHPVAYADDTTKLCGQVLKHDDSVNDRSAGARLQDSWEATRNAWQAEFRSEPFKAGGM